MRRTTALIAGLVLVGALGGCSEDPAEADAQFCAAASELAGDVDSFQSMAQSGASFDDLQVQATAVAAAAKDLSADAQRLEQAPRDEMNAAYLQLESALKAVDLETMSEEAAKTAVSTAVSAYEATATRVTAEVGCATESN